MMRQTSVPSWIACACFALSFGCGGTPSRALGGDAVSDLRAKLKRRLLAVRESEGTAQYDFALIASSAVRLDLAALGVPDREQQLSAAERDLEDLCLDLDGGAVRVAILHKQYARLHEVRGRREEARSALAVALEALDKDLAESGPELPPDSRELLETLRREVEEQLRGLKISLRVR